MIISIILDNGICIREGLYYHIANLYVGWLILSYCIADTLLLLLDSFTVPLHSPKGRHLPAIRAVQSNYC